MSCCLLSAAASRYFCGYHSYTILNGVSIKFGFVGNSETQCPGACTAQVKGPNGDRGVDGMASVLAHELAEVVTDPELNAWYDANGQENADKCEWTFGTLYAVSNGAAANTMVLHYARAMYCLPPAR